MHAWYSPCFWPYLREEGSLLQAAPHTPRTRRAPHTSWRPWLAHADRHLLSDGVPDGVPDSTGPTQAEALGEILGDQIETTVEDEHYIHKLKVHCAGAEGTVMEVLILKDSAYPFEPPTIVLVNRKLPAYM